MELPAQAYTKEKEFVSMLRRAIHDTGDGDLEFIHVHYKPKALKISLNSSDHKTGFKLCFKHGPHKMTSCHPVLAFDGEDTEYLHHHTGHARAITMNLGLAGGQIAVLAKELMRCYDDNDNNLCVV